MFAPVTLSSYMVATPLPSTSGTAASRLSEDTEVDNILPSVTPEDVSHIQPRPSDAYISDTQPFSHHQSPHHTSTSQPTWASTQPASSHLSATRASYPSGPGRRPKSGADLEGRNRRTPPKLCKHRSTHTARIGLMRPGCW